MKHLRQSTPIVEIIGERINTQEAFDAAIARAMALTPDGGTCPTAAVERALGQIMQYDYRERPYKAAIL